MLNDCLMKAIRSFEKSAIPQPRDQRGFTIPSTLDVEIGSGVGYFAIQYAQTHPERFLLAIERTKIRFGKFERRIQNHQVIKNLRIVCSDAENLICHRIPPQSVDRYFLMYPNPYQKKNQQKRRWHERSFMSYLLETLKPGGTITLATNVEEYVEQARKRYTQTWGLDLIEEKTREDKPRTHFEKKYLKRKKSCFNLVFQKRI